MSSSWSTNRPPAPVPVCISSMNPESHSAASETLGPRNPPIVSSRFFQETLSLSKGSACAFALPANSRRSSRRMIFWAPSVSPLLTSALIWSCCCLVNETPTRRSAVMPFTGSLRALPTAIVLLRRLVPIAALMSVISPVAVSKTLLPLPASLRTRVKVSRRFSAPWIASSSIPARTESWLARLPMCPAVTFASPPVDLMTAAVCFPAFSASRHSATLSPPILASSAVMPIAPRPAAEASDPSDLAIVPVPLLARCASRPTCRTLPDTLPVSRRNARALRSRTQMSTFSRGT